MNVNSHQILKIGVGANHYNMAVPFDGLETKELQSCKKKNQTSLKLQGQIL